MATCYRHPNRETGVSCSNCGNPICPDCMTTTPVGMRCPECSAQKTKVHTISSMTSPPRATYALLAINLLIFLGTSSQGQTANVCGFSVAPGFSLCGPLIEAQGEYWRLVTWGFLHANFLHVGFNLYALYWLGNEMEPSLGTARFSALYFAGLMGGAFGALLLTPAGNTVGASGAVFGLFGAAFVMQRARGIDPMQSGIGVVILLNLGITFLIPNISVGGHLGGLVAGAAAAWAMDQVAARRRGIALPVAACLLVSLVCVVGALAVDGRALS